MNQHAFGKQNYAHAECKNAHSPKNRSALSKEKMTKFILEKIFKCISNICIKSHAGCGVMVLLLRLHLFLQKACLSS